MENNYFSKRYNRHLILKEIGYVGQKKLEQAKVLIIGVGGLGSPVSMYLASAGVGTIGMIDADQVDESNLQRQILYQTEDVGKSKVKCAEKKIKSMNPFCNVILFECMFSDENAEQILKEFDFIVDCTDNFTARYCINKNCRLQKKTYIYGSVQNFEGVATVFSGENGPCYQCLFEKPLEERYIPGKIDIGIIGGIPGVIGSIQATETIKLICGIGSPLINRVLIYNALDMEFQTMEYQKKEQCPLCGKGEIL